MYPVAMSPPARPNYLALVVTESGVDHRAPALTGWAAADGIATRLFTADMAFDCAASIFHSLGRLAHGGDGGAGTVISIADGVLHLHRHQVIPWRSAVLLVVLDNRPRHPLHH